MENQPSSSKNEGSLPSKDLALAPARDIAPLLTTWEYEPGTINVRKIIGIDGSAKLQMRIELGVLQMEMSGRPDGVRPNGCESLLDFFETQLHEHLQSNGSEIGFHLTKPQCESLRHEASMYYHRYLSLFVLEDYHGVIRDTSRNLRVLDLCAEYAVDEQDRLGLEQYRPYILMMHARATASLLLNDNKTQEAYRTVRKAIRTIRNFFDRFGQPAAFKMSNEVKVLKRFAREIKAKLPVDPLQRLQKDLEKAVEAERYEDAARLRDEITRMQDVES